MRYSLLALSLVVAAMSTAWAAAPPPDPAPDVQVLTRGPIHEAFAAPSPGVAVETIVVPKQPPEAIEEIPPSVAPDEEGAVWIPGYWAWDDETRDFLWISGVWRVPPPGTTWVSGYWTAAEGGWRWVPGFWGSLTEQTVEYYPPPPDSLERGPTSDPPSATHFWVPGGWVWRDMRYAWRPGYWAPGYDGWVWVPASYIWSPRGWVYLDGYWDYPLTDRGLLFAPVQFSRYSPDYRFSPTVVVDPGLLTLHLFARPRYCHYYFGDYYADGYSRFGIVPWYEIGHQGHYRYDPLFAYYRWHTHQREPNWERDLRQWHRYFHNHEDLRPPHTLAAMQDFRRQVGNRTDVNQTVLNNVALAAPVQQFRERPNASVRLVDLNENQRNQARDFSREFRDARIERSKIEAQSAVGATGKPTGVERPQRLRLTGVPTTQRLEEASRQIEGRPARVAGEKPATGKTPAGAVSKTPAGAVSKTPPKEEPGRTVRRQPPARLDREGAAGPTGKPIEGAPRTVGPEKPGLGTPKTGLGKPEMPAEGRPRREPELPGRDVGKPDRKPELPGRDLGTPGKPRVEQPTEIPRRGPAIRTETPEKPAGEPGVRRGPAGATGNPGPSGPALERPRTMPERSPQIDRKLEAPRPEPRPVPKTIQPEPRKPERAKPDRGGLRHGAKIRLVAARPEDRATTRQTPPTTVGGVVQPPLPVPAASTAPLTAHVPPPAPITARLSPSGWYSPPAPPSVAALPPRPQLERPDLDFVAPPPGSYPTRPAPMPVIPSESAVRPGLGRTATQPSPSGHPDALPMSRQRVDPMLPTMPEQPSEAPGVPESRTGIWFSSGILTQGDAIWQPKSVRESPFGRTYLDPPRRQTQPLQLVGPLEFERRLPPNVVWSVEEETPVTEPTPATPSSPGMTDVEPSGPPPK